MSTPTFVFTDVEGSTRLWEEDDAAMDAALRRHDAIAEEVVAVGGGRIFKHTGDGFCAVFESAPAAVACAAEFVRRLDAEAWQGVPALRSRAAVHTGEATRRDDDWFGPTLNRTARLRDAAHGGQVVVSGETADLARRLLPAGHEFLDLGEHRLKDLGRPERIYQVHGPGLSAAFSPLRTLEVHPNNLPAQLTSFVGREAELDALGELLERTRMLTLTGIGGVGKTRLALQAAAEAVDRHPDGVWLVELASIGDEALVVGTIAAAVGVAEEPGRAVLDTLIGELHGRRTLLVLDNCEHLLDEAAKVAERLLRALPELRILCTSREGLAIGGEVLWQVPSLDRGDATTLFVDRARQIRPEFGVTTADEHETIERICRRLDGIPLAIELATARLKVLTPGQIATRLDDRFRLLTGGSRTALARQRTLQATMDWSHDLLGSHERALLRRLGVFSGGFSFDAVEAVCADDAVPSYEVLDLLTHLADASLVLVDQAGGVARYGLLETVRQYALDRLADAGEGDEFRGRHAEHFREMARRIDAALLGPEADLWMGRLRRDADNLRAAATWASDAGETVAALDIAAGMARYLAYIGAFTEGRARLGRVLGIPADPSPQLSRAQVWAGHFALMQGDLEEAEEFIRAAAVTAQATGDEELIHRSMVPLGNLAAAANRPREALRHYLAVAEWARSSDPDYLHIALVNIATHAGFAGEEELARAAVAELAEIADQRGQEIQIAYARSSAAFEAAWHGRPEEAEYHGGRALELSPDAVAVVEPGVRYSLALAAFELGRRADAERHASRSAELARQSGDVGQEEGALALLGQIAYEAGDAAEARLRWSAAYEVGRGRWKAGELARWGHALAQLAIIGGDAEEAAALLSAGEAWMAERGLVGPSLMRRLASEGRNRIEGVLSEEALRAARARGQGFDDERLALAATRLLGTPPGGQRTTAR